LAGLIWGLDCDCAHALGFLGVGAGPVWATIWDAGGQRKWVGKWVGDLRMIRKWQGKMLVFWVVIA
jgi:hypothetical protein